MAAAVRRDGVGVVEPIPTAMRRRRPSEAKGRWPDGAAADPAKAVVRRGGRRTGHGTVAR